MSGSDGFQMGVQALRRDRAVFLLIAAGMFYLGISGWFAEGLSAALRIGSLIPFLAAILRWSPRPQVLGAPEQGAGEPRETP